MTEWTAVNIVKGFLLLAFLLFLVGSLIIYPNKNPTTTVHNNNSSTATPVPNLSSLPDVPKAVSLLPPSSIIPDTMDPLLICNTTMSPPRTATWDVAKRILVNPACNGGPQLRYTAATASSCLTNRSILFTGQSVLHALVTEIEFIFGRVNAKPKSRYAFETWYNAKSRTHLDFSFSYAHHIVKEEEIRSIERHYEVVVIALGIWETIFAIQDPMSMYENLRKIVRTYYNWFPNSSFIIMNLPFIHQPHYIPSFRHICIPNSLQEKIRIIVKCAAKSILPDALHFDSYAYTFGSYPASVTSKDGMHYPQHHPVRIEGAQGLLRGLCYHNATTIKNLPKDHPDRLKCPSNWRDLVNYTCNIACRCDGVWADRSYCQEQKRTREQDRGVSMPTCYNNSATDDQILQDYKRWMADFYRKKKKP